jgi:anaerobic ribonucleoside-triphosphate reductase activating protein
LELLQPDYIKGLSILGGNPTEPQNEPELIEFVKRVKQYYPNKDIWLWSGHTYEELLARNDELLKYCDVLIEGPFIICYQEKVTIFSSYHELVRSL